jgi:hypothetical protein
MQPVTQKLSIMNNPPILIENVSKNNILKIGLIGGKTMKIFGAEYELVDGKDAFVRTDFLITLRDYLEHRSWEDFVSFANHVNRFK